MPECLFFTGLTIGWEAWTRTRIARSRVWSPTNWTTSQPGEEQKGIAALSRGSGQPRFSLSNLIGNQEGVNRTSFSQKLGTYGNQESLVRLRTSRRRWLRAPVTFINRNHAASLDDVFITTPGDSVRGKTRQPNDEIQKVPQR